MATRTKECSKCRRALPRSEFYGRRGARDGLRAQCKTCYGRNDKKNRGQNAPGGGRLPIGPFRKWLKWRLDYYEGQINLLAQATGLDERSVFRCLHENETVSLDLVDKALIAEGSTPLWSLAYSEEDFQKAARECARSESRKQ